ncbi:hypothetical protein NX059_010000 [Plenodomus lindquistii]|nr:hypothetical protein NX059_010000 [Plenodomus lindquistii]
MLPKAPTKALAGRGRPKRTAASEPAPVANTTPAKRGRPAKAGAVEAAVEPPKKRGKPSKAAEAEVAVQVTTAPAKRGRRSLVAPDPEPEQEPVQEPKKGRGRPKKDAGADAEAIVPEAAAPKKTTSRGPSRKEDALVETPATPKRGRPAKAAALDLNAVAGSPRIGKRTSPRTSKTKPSKAAAVTPRLDPRVRSKLRSRVPSTKKVTQEAPVAQPSKRGRPKKTAPKPAPTPKKTVAANKTTGRKPSKVVAEKPTKASVANPAKISAPRKRRGYTTLEIPDKFAKAVEEFYENLLAADAVEPIDTPLEDGEASNAENEAAENKDEEVPLTSATAGAEEDVNGAAASESDIEAEVDQQEPTSEAVLEQDLDGVLQTTVDEDDEQYEEDPNPFTSDRPSPEGTLPLNIEQVQREQTMEMDSAGNIVEEFDEEVVLYEGTSEPQATSEQDGYSEEDDFRRPSPKPSGAALFTPGF